MQSIVLLVYLLLKNSLHKNISASAFIAVHILGMRRAWCFKFSTAEENLQQFCCAPLLLELDLKVCALAARRR